VRILHGILAKMFPAQPQPITEVSVGRLATVRGVVVPRDLMDSPLTGDRCVYYHYTVEQWRQSRVVGVGGDGFWDVIEQDEAILEFYVEDETGRAIVAPERSRVTLGRRVEQQHIELMMNRRARQVVLEPGDVIEVTAETVLVDDLFDEGRSYRASPGRMLLRAPEDSSLDIRLVDKRAP
jgi:hypothetical protein